MYIFLISSYVNMKEGFPPIYSAFPRSSVFNYGSIKYGSISFRPGSDPERRIPGIGAKILPENKFEFLSLFRSFFGSKDLQDQYNRFIDILSSKRSLTFQLFDRLNDVNYYDIYLTKDASWSDFKIFFRSMIDQVYFDHALEFSQTFHRRYLAFINSYFEKFAPIGEVNFLSPKIRFPDHSIFQTTLYNYQHFMTFKEIAEKRSYSYYWNRTKEPKLKNLNNFDLIFALRGELIDQEPEFPELMIYSNNTLSSFGYGPDLFIDSEDSKMMIEDLFEFHGASEILAFSKK